MADLHGSFFKQIENNFGHDTARAYKDYATNNIKLANMSVRKDFLLNCRRNGIFPAHIINTLKCIYPLLEEGSPYIPKLDRLVGRFKKALLNIEIQHTFHKISKLKHSLVHAKQVIENNSSSALSTEFVQTQQTAFTSRKATAESTTRSKLNRLLAAEPTNSAQLPKRNEKAVFNSTTVTLPVEVQTLLSMGPKFALPIHRLQPNTVYHLIADIESVLRTNPDKAIQDRNRCLIGTRVQNFLTRTHLQEAKTPLERFCGSATFSMKKFLAEHPEICIVESDKGKKMVVMLRQDYDTKMLDLLNEPNTYKILKTDPTSRIQNTVNNMVKRIAHLGLIDQHTVRTLQTHTATCPRIYGQPKAHKPNLPLRPVVPTITAPTYNLSKFIAKILQQTFTSQYNVADSFTFANFINQTTIPPDHILVSFDVVSLFTNIPNELVRRSIIFRWTEIKQGTNINLDLFLEMVELCMDSSYFRFRDKYYQQTFGTAMGSPLSPILADYITEDLLETVVKNSDLNIPIVKKYVDDLFLVLPRTEVQNVLDTFNQYNAHLQFTVEKEIDGSLPFLDTLAEY
ncbi:uncharacterized protein LOC134209403 [Armigeres subalbatus]|uniref:uncharacterized protein LOC134209403 n=1 Tax=Armigeres subalbatus TaxID=124917 RepID=UPI002ED50D5A